MRPLGRYYILLPGIRTNPADWRNWAPKMASEINLRCRSSKADEFRYYAHAITPKGRQDERAEYVSNLAIRAYHAGFSPVLVGHSNGCEVIRQALADSGPVVHSVHLIAGATDANFNTGGWNEYLRKGKTGHICCYVGRKDWVLRWVAAAGAALGYGRLGYLGPQEVAGDVAHKVTVIERDVDHCGWFIGDNFASTFDAVTVGERLHE